MPLNNIRMNHWSHWKPFQCVEFRENKRNHLFNQWIVSWGCNERLDPTRVFDGDAFSEFGLFDSFFRFFSYCRSYFVGGDASVGVVFVIQIGGRQQDLARTRFLVSFQWHQCVTLLLRSWLCLKKSKPPYGIRQEQFRFEFQTSLYWSLFGQVSL